MGPYRSNEIEKTGSFLNIESIIEAWFLRVFHFNNNKKGVPLNKKMIITI